MDQNANPDWRPETLAVRAGEPSPLVDGAVSMPLFQSSTYLTGEAGTYRDLRYVRLNNTPNHEATAAKLAALEGLEAGLLTASGMAAITTAILSVVSEGGHLIAQDCLYGGTRELLRSHSERFGIETSFVSLEDPDTWAEALRPTTRAVYVESTTNPLLDVGRLDDVADFAAANDLVSIIDNTFPSPVGFRPKDLGFHVVVHSATKSLGGHSDLVAGALLGSTPAVGRARDLLNLMGGSLDPFACWLLQRGLKTLPLRVRQQSSTALALASLLSDHEAVELVRHPGLPGDPSHARAARWFTSGGSMVSFVPRGGQPAAERIMARLRIPLLAPSLGGVETLVSQPSRTSHAGLAAADRAALGIPEEMIRVSVGIEAAEDLLEDFRQALDG